MCDVGSPKQGIEQADCQFKGLVVHFDVICMPVLQYEVYM